MYIIDDKEEVGKVFINGLSTSYNVVMFITICCIVIEFSSILRRIIVLKKYVQQIKTFTKEKQ